MAGFLLLVDFSRKRKKHISWWQWILTLLAFVYFCFVLEMIAGFLKEGAPRAALIMGMVFGFIALIWAVLLGRFVFFKK